MSSVLDFPKAEITSEEKARRAMAEAKCPASLAPGEWRLWIDLGIAPSRAGLVKLGHVALDGTKISGSDAGICATCITATTSCGWWRNLRG